MLEQMLSRHGIWSKLVYGGHADVNAAISAAHAGWPYEWILISMDLQMPDLSELAATHKLRDCGLDKPVIAITGLSLPVHFIHCLESGCQEVLMKPIKFQQLVYALTR